MKFLVVLMAAVACQAAPQQILPYSVVQTAPLVAHGISNSPAVMKIPKPGIRFGVPAPVSYSAPVVVAAPAAPVAIAAPAPAPVPVAAPVQYSVPAVPAVPVPAPVQYSAPAVPAVPVPAVPVPAVPAPAAVVTPTVYAAPPEPLAAPEPPMPSVGTPFVGGQYHAQDEAGQYSFVHWGGPNTRVETRDSFGRTSGSFAYVDPVGDVQVRKYAAAPATGFKVAASDLP